MKQLTHYILSHLVEHPDALVVTETDQGNGNIIITISVAKEDMGRVIGKEGKVIKSIRDVVKILAVKENKHVDVVLAE